MSGIFWILFFSEIAKEFGLALSVWWDRRSVWRSQIVGKFNQIALRYSIYLLYWYNSTHTDVN
jgi:hypothetical protein